MKHRTQRKNRRSSLRRALAAVELAVCLPVLVLLMLGAIESSNMIFLRQALVQSAYEAAKLSARPDATAAEAVTRGADVLNARNISGHTVTLSPSNTESLLRGTDIVATTTAPMDANRLVSFTPFAGRTVTVTMTAVKH
ncbi:MAG: TadE/TadG family type IV pilus assembly protein [Bythopirellula sp.]